MVQWYNGTFQCSQGKTTFSPLKFGGVIKIKRLVSDHLIEKLNDARSKAGKLSSYRKTGTMML